VEKEDSSLLAEKMTVTYYEKQEDDTESKIKRIDAKENVKIFTDEFIGSGDSGYFEPDKNIFVLEKNVVINNGTSIASGDKFIYDLTTKKGNFVGKKEETVGTASDVQSTDKRVTVVIGDDVKQQKKSKKSQEENEQQNP
jgi:lipopolysaccharide export system protein LptA